jgi:DNA sulfur modification protein DndC
VTEDKALHGLVASGMEWMRPFLDFRNMLYQTTLPENKKEYRNYRRRSGRIDLMRQKDEKGQLITALNEDGSINEEYDPNYVPGPYWMKYRQQWLRDLLEIQKKIDEQGHDHLAITDNELVQIRREWLMDPIDPDWSDSLPKIVAELYPEKMHLFPSRDIGAFGETELNVVKKMADNEKISPILLKKIIDAEVEVSGLGNRRGIRKKIESILRQDWDELGSTMEKAIGYKREVEVFKDVRTELEKTLQELTR